MKPEIKAQYKDTFLVLLEEEYGYRKWFWFPSMSMEVLERWWSALETVKPYTLTPEPLPGDLYRVEFDDEFELYKELELNEAHYTAHIFHDDDSVLTRPDNTKLYHKGYSVIE